MTMIEGHCRGGSLIDTGCPYCRNPIRRPMMGCNCKNELLECKMLLDEAVSGFSNPEHERRWKDRVKVVLRRSNSVDSGIILKTT